MACNYKCLSQIDRARYHMKNLREVLDKLPNSIWLTLAVFKLKEAELYINKLEEDYKNV